MSEGSLLEAGHVALKAGRWGDARSAFQSSLADVESAEAHFGLAVAHWWLGENHASIAECTRAYSMFQRAGDVERAAPCAIWLTITYKANFANFAAANGWIGRADRLLEPLPPGPLHGWAWVARAYRMADLESAARLTASAVDLARGAGDVDLELVALSQLGLIRVGQGDTEAGFALIDEAMAAALAGEQGNLDTVVYACCDMLSACELVSDFERAAQWCQVADAFVQTYGCPFLYAECRIAYGSVLTASGRWDEAERELVAGLRITDGACPGLHARARTRLAVLRTRQGRLEEAARLLDDVGQGVEADAEAALALGALLLARGDAPGARRNLEHRLRRLEEHRWHLAAALDLLVAAHVEAGDPTAAAVAADRLAMVVAPIESQWITGLVASARGRVAGVCGDRDGAVTHWEAALAAWSGADHPFEQAGAQVELGRLLLSTRRDAAVDHVRRALATFELIGAAREADRAAALLRSMGVVGRTGPKGVSPLTAREQEVLGLVAAGLSNGEIAARLYVSRKTASHHVSNILAKLHVRNRAEAAAVAAATLDRAGGLSSH